VDISGGERDRIGKRKRVVILQEDHALTAHVDQSIRVLLVDRHVVEVVDSWKL
jgi:hypothetical protein